MVLIMLDKELCVWGHGHPFYLLRFSFLTLWDLALFMARDGRCSEAGWCSIYACCIYSECNIHSLFLFFCQSRDLYSTLGGIMYTSDMLAFYGPISLESKRFSLQW